MADIIGFPSEVLTPEERMQVEKFVRDQVADFQDTSCNSVDEIQEQVAILLGYFRRFADVVETRRQESIRTLILDCFYWREESRK